MLGAVWLLQRRFTRGAGAKQRPRDAVRVVAKRGIGAKAQVVVVEIDEVRYVLGVGDGGVSVLDSRPVEGEPARPAIAPVIAPVRSLRSAAPALVAPAPASAPDAALPLRRTRRAELAAQPARLSATLPREAAQALRRALGA